MTNTEFLDRYELLPKGSHVLCALSGGRDSVYLMYRLLEWAEERQLTISAAHFNHHLRGAESDRDEKFVAALCETLRVPLFVGGSDVRMWAETCGQGTEETARALRYNFLEHTRQQIGADVIATAHHADDLAETMLFQMARGSGTRGLSGIPPRRGHIVRPLLLTARSEINDWLQSHEITYVEDSTNALTDCSRNKIRHQVMPVLEEINPQFVRHAAQSALLLREDDEYLQKQADLFMQNHPPEQGVDGKALSALEWPVASRVVRMVWGNGLTAGHVQHILDLCDRSELAYAHVPGAVVRYDAGRLWTETNKMPLTEIVLAGERGEATTGGFQIRWKVEHNIQEIHNSLNTFCVKCESIESTVRVTAKQDGDRVKLAGGSCTKKLKQLFQERKLTQPQRASVPVFRDEQGIVAVYGFGIAQRCVPEIGDTVIYIQCENKRENGG